MSDRDAGETVRQLMLILAAVGAMVALLMFAADYVRKGARAGSPEPTAVLPATEWIATEADVFRTAPEHVTIPPTATRRSGAHRRTLAMYRTLRAYPGAPPRIPHGLTIEEFRAGSCTTCHERGGYVERFGAYAPVTPHPEYRSCLQCHVPEDGVVGIRPPGSRPDAQCLQCHVPDGRTPLFAAVDWRALTPPPTDQRAMPDSPPLVPHDFEMRGDCLRCHMGPAAVEEIRTTHPERANCRQCHVPAAREEAEFTRPAERGRPAGEGAA